MLNLLLAVVFNFSLPIMNAEPGAVFTQEPNSVILVEAYFNSCPYCNENAGNVDEVADFFSGTPRVKVLDVGIDRQDSAYESWIEKHRPNHPVLKDANRKLIKQLGTTSYPSTYVIDCKGNVVFKSSGSWSSQTKARVKQAVNQALETECSPRGE